MKYLLHVLLPLFFFSCNSPSQESSKEEKSPPTISVQNWADTLDKQNEIGLFSEKYELKEYTQGNEKHALFFNAHTYTTDSGKELQDSLLASSVLIQNEMQIVEWEMRDFIRKEDTDKLPAEKHIYFWEEYMSLTDLDEDALVEPVLVYGTSALNGLDDGRVKILLYYKGNKVGIRHQSGVLDFERNTQVDSAFYQLPSSIQVHVKELMEQMAQDKGIIFPAGWEIAMKEEKTYFDEN